MALTTVTARARTRGKSPKPFTFNAIGKLETRKVLDKDQNPIVLDKDGKQVAYAFDKDGKVVTEGFSQNDKGELILPDGLSFVEVDEVDTKGITDKLEDVIELFGAMSEDERGKRSALQMVIDSALDGYNYQSRKNAAPTTEQDTTDELTPITAALVEKKILSDKDATTWRRNISAGAKTFEQDRLTFAKMSPQYKKLVAAGWTPEATA